MELSLVLWNCNGKEGTKGQKKATVSERQSVFRSTYDSWQQGNMIPNVLLAQELFSGGITTTWRELSEKSKSFGVCEAACFFLKHLGQKVEFLDSGNLQRIMDGILLATDRYDEGIGRIHCGIVTLGSEKILICSWHGKYRNTSVANRKVLMRKMLFFVNKVKEDQGCVAALVGGDFNLDKTEVDQTILDPAQSVILYDDYENPTYRPSFIDYVIAWPKNRFKLRGSGEIETNPREIHNANPRIFDHALIRYDFRVMLTGEWKGKGKVKWCGERGEGEVTLTGDDEEKTRVKVRNMSGEWKGEGEGSCSHFGNFKIEGGNLEGNLEVDCRDGNGWSLLAEGQERTFTNETPCVAWRGSGKVKWEGTEAKCECFGGINCEQTVKWNGTGEVEWKGEGEATWLGGKLEEWKGNQTVKWAGDQLMRWSGGGKVEFKGGELKYFSCKGNWTLLTESVFGVERSRTWSARTESTILKELEWKGRGVSWEVTGEGTGEMM